MGFLHNSLTLEANGNAPESPLHNKKGATKKSLISNRAVYSFESGHFMRYKKAHSNYTFTNDPFPLQLEHYKNYIKCVSMTKTELTLVYI